jgi:hypothetical protein
VRVEENREHLVGPPIQVVHYGDEERFEHEACIPIASEATVNSVVDVRELKAAYR